MEYYIYETVQNDRWDKIAGKFRGNVFDYNDIIEDNPHVPVTPVLEEGITIRIAESKDTSDKKGLPVWKQ